MTRPKLSHCVLRTFIAPEATGSPVCDLSLRTVIAPRAKRTFVPPQANRWPVATYPAALVQRYVHECLSATRLWRQGCVYDDWHFVGASLWFLFGNRRHYRARTRRGRADFGTSSSTFGRPASRGKHALSYGAHDNTRRRVMCAAAPPAAPRVVGTAAAWLRPRLASHPRHEPGRRRSSCSPPPYACG